MNFMDMTDIVLNIQFTFWIFKINNFRKVCYSGYFMAEKIAIKKE